MTKNPFIRKLKKARRAFEDKLMRIMLTYGAEGIANDPEIRASCARMLANVETLKLAIRDAREAERLDMCMCCRTKLDGKWHSMCPECAGKELSANLATA